MRAEQFIYESRGVTARAPGETYVSDIDPNDILTIQSITVLPSEGDGYESTEEMLDAVGQYIGKDLRVDDNNTNSGTKAAAIATVTNSKNNTEHHVRYLKAIPATGVHGLWKTIKGYKFGKGAKEESVPVKPSDLIKDENYRDAGQLSQEIISNTSHLEGLGEVMKTAIEHAMSGSSQAIPNAGQYFNVLQKYSGEYLGPIALMNKPNTVTGDTASMMQTFGISNFSGAKVSFPQDTAMELIDSVIQLPDGRDIQISSKISTSGGAASSLSGVYKNTNAEIKQRFPAGSKIIETLATKSAVSGPLQVAFDLKLIDQADVQALTNMDKASKNLQDLGTERLMNMTKAQGVASGTLERPDYRVFYHALTAVMNAVIPVVNASEDFKNAMLAVLNNNQYVQLVTKGKQTGEDVSLTYFTKFPAVFKGSAQLVNKNYFATGQKGRIGFKLK